MKITTYHPSIKRMKRKYGFLVRKRTAAGRKVLLRRRRKGRWKLTV